MGVSARCLDAAAPPLGSGSIGETGSNIASSCTRTDDNARRVSILTSHPARPRPVPSRAVGCPSSHAIGRTDTYGWRGDWSVRRTTWRISEWHRSPWGKGGALMVFKFVCRPSRQAQTRRHRLPSFIKTTMNRCRMRSSWLSCKPQSACPPVSVVDSLWSYRHSRLALNEYTNLSPQTQNTSVG